MHGGQLILGFPVIFSTFFSEQFWDYQVWVDLPGGWRWGRRRWRRWWRSLRGCGLIAQCWEIWDKNTHMLMLYNCSILKGMLSRNPDKLQRLASPWAGKTPRPPCELRKLRRMCPLQEGGEGRRSDASITVGCHGLEIPWAWQIFRKNRLRLKWLLKGFLKGETRFPAFVGLGTFFIKGVSWNRLYLPTKRYFLHRESWLTSGFSTISLYMIYQQSRPVVFSSHATPSKPPPHAPVGHTELWRTGICRKNFRTRRDYCAVWNKTWPNFMVNNG